MLTTTIFPIILITATLLCALVAGLLFAFAIVTMPGIKSLNDREFIRAFQVMDGVIQNNQPIFMLVWLGSALTLLPFFSAQTLASSLSSCLIWSRSGSASSSFML